jgi:FAD/FMN-containing dehydrogenase
MIISGGGFSSGDPMCALSNRDIANRSTASNSLSIWLHHMQGISFSKGFKPKGYRHSIDTDAVTFAAGTLMGELNAAAALKNLTIISGGQRTVGYGGYMTGGGHGALGATYGMAADQVLELEVVTPSGEIVIANECKNKDLFWALRGVCIRTNLMILLADWLREEAQHSAS